MHVRSPDSGIPPGSRLRGRPRAVPEPRVREPLHRTTSQDGRPPCGRPSESCSFRLRSSRSGSRGTYYLRRTDLASVYAFAGQNQLRRARVTLGLSDVAIGNGGKRTPRSIDVFSPANVPFLTRGSRVWWYGSSANLGAVDDSLLPAIGVHFRPDVRRYRSSDGTNLRYDQWRLEARGYLPVFAKRRVLAGRLVYEGVDRRGGAAPGPALRLPETSPPDRFAADTTGRFP